MRRTEKAGVAERLGERFRRSPTLYLTDFTGLSVAQMTEFRRRLRAVGVEYVVVKNRIARRALDSELASSLGPHLAGPTGVVLAGRDPVGAARVLAEFAREFQRPTVKVGYMDGKALLAEQVRRLATLPPRDQLLGQMGGTLQAPMAALAGALNGLLYNVVGALEALRAKRAGTES